jgi:serine/threonine protein kinase
MLVDRGVRHDSQSSVSIRDVMLQHVPVLRCCGSDPGASSSSCALSLPRDVAARYRRWNDEGYRSLDPQLRRFTAFDDRLGGRKVFIKVCPKGSDDDRTQHAQHVAKLLMQLKHPRLVPLHESISTSSYVLSVAPLLTGGSLWDGLRRREEAQSPMTEEDVIAIVRNVLQGLGCLHAEGIRYGSLHPSKLVYTDVQDAVHQVRLSSFRGSYTATRVTRGAHPPVFPRSASDVSQGGLHVGAIPFMAPEDVVFVFGGNALFRHRLSVTATALCSTIVDEAPAAPPGLGADVWGVGVLAFLLLTGRYPCWGRGESPYHVLQDIVCKGFNAEEARRSVEPFIWPPPHLLPEAMASCPSSERIFREVQLARGSMLAPALDFISLCLQARPADRISVQEALLHPWLTGRGALEPPSERVLADVARRVYASPLATLSWAQPGHLGRYAGVLQSYQSACQNAQLRPNSGVLSMLCHPGHWRDREHLVFDLSQSGSCSGACGPLGCSIAVQAVLAELRTHMTTSGLIGRSGPPPQLHLKALVLAQCNLNDTAVTVLMHRCMEFSDVLLPTLAVLDLRDNPMLTNDSGRSLLRLLSFWERQRNRRRPSQCKGEAREEHPPPALRVLVGGTNIDRHLIARMEVQVSLGGGAVEK